MLKPFDYLKNSNQLQELKKITVDTILINVAINKSLLFTG